MTSDQWPRLGSVPIEVHWTPSKLNFSSPDERQSSWWQVAQWPGHLNAWAKTGKLELDRIWGNAKWAQLPSFLLLSQSIAWSAYFARWWSTWSWESTWSWMQVLKACLCMMQGRPLCTLQFNWQPSLHKLGLSSRVAKEQPELKQQTQQNSILGVVGQNTNTQKRGNSGYSLT